MTTIRNKSRYDKEMSAVTYNMKEQRVLEKSMQTLKLEQTYALKLLDLDNRIIKVNYKKLKEKVSKIKSHLPPEDISKFRDLDQRGKLKSTHSGMYLSSAVKIAAASRRLNLNSGGGSRVASRRGVRSAMPRISVNDENEHEAKSSRRSAVSKPTSSTASGKLKRSNSVTGVFIDAPQPEQIVRPGFALTIPRQYVSNPRPEPEPQEAYASLLVQQNNSIVEHLTVNDAVTLPHRPSSSVTFQHKPDHGNGTVVTADGAEEEQHPHREHAGFTLKRASTAPHSAYSHSHSHSHSPFSSHVTTEKDAKSSEAGRSPRPDWSRRLSHISNDSIDSNLGEDMFEERRQELLEEECVRAASLDRRTKLFLKEVDDYMIKHPPLQLSHVAFETNPLEPPRHESLNTSTSKDPFGDSSGFKSRFKSRNNDRPSNMDNFPTFLPEDEYKDRLLSLWKDMNKCRYLRLPDEMIDLSGVNTLVKDQMKLFDMLRHPETSSGAEA